MTAMFTSIKMPAEAIMNERGDIELKCIMGCADQNIHEWLVTEDVKVSHSSKELARINGMVVDKHDFRYHFDIVIEKSLFIKMMDVMIPVIAKEHKEAINARPFDWGRAFITEPRLRRAMRMRALISESGN